MAKIFRLKSVTISVIIFFFSLTCAATQVISSELLFVLDCSGSMWGRVDNQPKIAIAKKVLKGLIEDVPDNVNMGLFTYGNRRKGDCSDISLVADIGSSKNVLIQQLINLNAKGKTPIEKALKQSLKVFSKDDSKKVLILISDGIETCNGDPCNYIKTLKEQGISFKIHVIGLNVNDKAGMQLQCIADAGEGGYFAAGNTQELKDALYNLKENIVKEKPLPEPPVVAQAEQKKSKSKRLKLPGPGTVILKPASWVKMPPRYWSLVDAETGNQVTRANANSTRVKPGEYQLAWRQNEHKSIEVTLTATVTVKSGKKVEMPVDTGIRITLPKDIPPPKWWALTAPETNDAIAKFSGQIMPQVIPAGQYNLLWRQKEHQATTVKLGIFEFRPGELNDIALDMGFNIQRADWVPKSFYYIALKDQQGKIIGKWTDMTAQIAPSGEYTVIIRPTQHNNNEIIWSKINIPDHGLVNVPIDSGIKFIHDNGVKPPYGIFFINLDTKNEIAVKETWASQILPSGRYKLDWWESQHHSKRQTLLEEFEVEPGILLELEI